MKRNLIPLLALLIAVAACTTSPRQQGSEGIQLPTMGWSSWNTYSVNISDSLIMSQADAMVSTGLADAGYNHINIDDGYFGGRDQQTGQLLIHPTRFPNGMKKVVDHIHSLGLKAGIYSDAGANTCGSYYNRDTIARGVGLYGHDQQDADFFFKELGFDFIKVDFCGGNAPQNSDRLALDPQERYTAIRKAIDNTGRKDVRLNVCRWDFPGVWVRDVAISWRMSHDIGDRWQSVKSIINQSLYLSAYAGGGHYNDMDMLEVGRSMSSEEDKTHFGIWCIMSSPLLIGCDMTTLRSEAFDLMTNRDLIALDQDPLGLQAYVVQHIGETYVFVKDIEERFGTVRAVAFYNPADEPCHMGIDLKDLDLAGGAAVRDLFERKDIGSVTDRLEADVPAHGTRIYRIAAKQRLERVRYEAETAWLSDYQELYNNQAFKTATYTPVEECSGGVAVTQLGFKPTNDIQWRDIWSPKGGEYKLTLRCLTNEPRGNMIYLSDNPDNARQVRIAAAEGWQDVEVTVNLKPGLNTIRIANDRSGIPDIDYMELQPLR
ncbi:MAG: alpha-galactosidase [Bacteroidales bacterium]|nr:alpha-galactosidase [Bacteroidales bacterium]